MVRSNSIAVLTMALTLCSAAAVAEAEEAEARETHGIRNVDLSIIPSVDFMLYRADFAELSYVNYGGAIGANYRDIVRGGLYFGGAYLDADLRGGDLLPVSMDLETEQAFTMGVFAAITPVRHGRFELTIRGSFLFPPGGVRASLGWDENYDIPDVIEDFAGDYLDTATSIRLPATLAWYRAEVSVVLGGWIGRWHPYFELAYMHVYTALEPELIAEAGVEDPGHQFIPRPSITDRLHIPWYWIGLDVNLPYSMAVGAKFMVLPLGGYGTLGAAMVSFTGPMNPRSRR